MEYYLSADAFLNTATDTLLNASPPFDFASAGSLSVSAPTLFVPIGTSAGNKPVIAFLTTGNDSPTNPDCTGTGNVVCYPTQVFSSPPPTGTLPDLIAQIHPGNSTLFTTVEAPSVVAQVVNIGQPWFPAVLEFGELGVLLDQAGQNVDEKNSGLGLGAMGTNEASPNHSLTFTFASLDAGSYQWRARIRDFPVGPPLPDEDPTNNTSAPVNFLVVSPGDPELGCSTLTASLSTVDLGGSLDVTCDYTNSGIGAGGNFRIGFYLSDDDNIHTSDSLLDSTSCVNLPVPAPGQMDSCTATVTVPTTVAPGNRFIGAFVDDLNQVTEEFEDNNGASSPLLVNAVPSGISVDPSAGTGSEQTFIATYSDADGVDDFHYTYLRFTDGGAWAGECVLQYHQNQGKVFILDDAGNDWGAGEDPGSLATLASSACSLDVSGVVVTEFDNILTIAYPLIFANPLAPETPTIELWAIDDNDSTSGWQQSGSWTIPVNSNQVPTANAGLDQTVTDADASGSEAVTLTGSGSDTDGTIASYEWKEGLTILGTTASLSASFTVGTHTLTLTVTDDQGATGSDNVVVTVNAAGGGGIFANGYSFRRLLTVNPANVAGAANLADFPLLVSGTYAYLKSTGNGGKVESASGYDIRFESVGGTKLDHEVERWNDTTGEFTAWVRIPTLNATSDTTIYLYYGNSVVSSTEENATGTWPTSAYKGVYHLAEDPGSTSTSSDSSGQYNGTYNGAMNSADLVSGKIGNAVEFDGSDDVVDTVNTERILTWTLSCWVNAPNLPSQAPGTGLISRGDNYSLTWDNGTTSSRGALVYKVGGTKNSVDFEGSGLSTNTWHHIAATFDGTEARTYKDGALVVSDSSVPGSPKNSPAGMALMGGAIDGILDEARVATVVRNGDWITTEYNNQNNPVTFTGVGAEESGTVVNQPPSLTNPANQTNTISDSVSLQIQATDPESDPLTYSASSLPTGLSINSSTGLISGSVGGGAQTYNASVTVNDGNNPDVTTNFTWTVNAAGGAMFPNNYSFRRLLTVGPANVAGTANLADFPLLVSGTYAYLKSTGNGGKVESASGYDIRFESVGGTKLDHEVERWNDTTGEFTAWVRIPTLNATSDTTIYLYYGNSVVSSTEENATGTWPTSAYKGVYHLAEDPGSTSTSSDSSGQYNGTYNGAMNSADLVSGKIGNAVEFDGSDDVVDTVNTERILAWTLSCWVNAPNLPSQAPGTGLISRGDNYSLTWDNGTTSFRGALVYKVGGTKNSVDFEGSGLSTNTWHHIAATFDGTEARTYKDGALVVSDSSVPGSPKNSPAGMALMGGAIDGILDEARVATVVRNGDWITTEYNNQNNPVTFTALGTEELP